MRCELIEIKIILQIVLSAVEPGEIRPDRNHCQGVVYLWNLWVSIDKLLKWTYF